MSDSATPWNLACQAPLSMGFSRQKYWNGLPCPPPGDFSDPGIEPESHVALALHMVSLPLSYQGSRIIKEQVSVSSFLSLVHSLDVTFETYGKNGKGFASLDPDCTGQSPPHNGLRSQHFGVKPLIFGFMFFITYHYDN